MRQEEAFEFLCRLAQGIASMFGDSCETVVHEMEGERMKNLVIFNGHVSGRSAGSTLSIYGRDTIQDDPEGTSLDQDFLNQMVVTPSGKNIKSSTFHLRGEGYHYALGINYDVSVMGAMRRLLENFTESSAAYWTLSQRTALIWMPSSMPARPNWTSPCLRCARATEWRWWPC